MKNLSYKKQTLDKISVKGVLSGDGTYITYEDQDGNAQTIEVAKYFKLMGGNTVTLSIALKDDKDCSEELNDLIDEE